MFETVKIDSEEWPELKGPETENAYYHCPVCNSMIDNIVIRVEQLTKNIPVNQVKKRAIYIPSEGYNGCCSRKCARLLYQRETMEKYNGS